MMKILSVILLLLCVRFPGILAADIPAGYVRAAESKNLELYILEDDASLLIYDKGADYVWNSSYDIDDPLVERTNKLWKGSMRSLVNMVYTDFTRILIANPASAGAVLEIEYNDAGLRVSYTFEELEIGFSLDIILADNELRVQIPASQISEGEVFGITKIRVLPFFGAAPNSENGYILYPDGSGALLRFREETYRPRKELVFNVYGPDLNNLDLYLEALQREHAHLPVFGMKRGNAAFAAVIDDGEHDASIHLSPSGHLTRLNRIAAEFTYRRIFTYIGPNMTEIPKVEPEIILEDRSVTYLFLSESQSSYSGMANAARKYLLANGTLVDTGGIGSDVPFGLDLFMRVKEDRLFLDRYVVMTTFEEAQHILEELHARGVENIHVGIKGWTKKGSGTPPVHFPPSRDIGGRSGLKALSEFATSAGDTLFLQDDFVMLNRDSSGFSRRRDAVFNRLDIAVTDRYNNLYLFNPVQSWEKYRSSFLPAAKRLGVGGVGFRNLGRLLYRDYNRRYPVSRTEAANEWTKFLERTKTDLGYNAVAGGNAYLLKYADRILNIPMEDSGYALTTEAVPFFQMVVHGLVLYSGDPGNLLYDYVEQTLQWVEYGCIPYFELTAKDPEPLKYTTYNELFSSAYEDWLDKAADFYSKYRETVGPLLNSYITDHYRVHEKLVRVTYRNGVRVYVNYGDAAEVIDGIRVEAMDYAVTDGATR
jgi:hypothetical protein